MADFTKLNGYTVKDPQAVHTYDTVADLKADTKLKAGNHAETKGYTTAGDGGHATYIIVNDNTLIDDGGSVHDLSNGLKAVLLTDDYVTPEMYGAYGDGVHDDTVAINKALENYNVCGVGTYLISDEIVCNGHNLKLSNVSGTPTFSNNSNHQKPVTLHIDTADTVTIQDFKNSEFYFGYITTLNITVSDGNNAFAYNTINGGHILNLYIYGNESLGWINENVFNNIRIGYILSIVSNGYHHNNNKFYDITVEDNTVITITGSYCNYFSYRGETLPTINLSDDNFTYGNIFVRNWYSFKGGYIQQVEKIENGNIFKSADTAYLNNYIIYNAEVDATTGKITLPAYTTLKTFYIDPKSGGAIRFRSDSESFRIRVTPLDENGDVYDANPNAIYQVNIPWNSTNKYYWQTVNHGKADFVINDSANVHKLKIEIYNYASSEAEYAVMDYATLNPMISGISN